MTLREEVRRHAEFACEYCRVLEEHLPFSAFHLDHIVARQHGGKHSRENLAWCCQECNLLKGTNLSGIDPKTGEVVLLFHPRKHLWTAHFEFLGIQIFGRTDTGRATAWLLRLNSPERLELRRTVLEAS